MRRTCLKDHCPIHTRLLRRPSLLLISLVTTTPQPASLSRSTAAHSILACFLSSSNDHFPSQLFSHSTPNHQLPQEDLEETTPACAALCQLLTGDATTQQRVSLHLPVVVEAFGRVAAHEAAPMDTRQHVARTLAQLQGRFPAVGPLCAALPPEQQQALQQLASG